MFSDWENRSVKSSTTQTKTNEEMIVAKTIDELERRLYFDSYLQMEKIVDSKGFSIGELERLSVDGLNAQIRKITDLTHDQKGLEEFGLITFERDQDFSLPDDVAEGLSSYDYNPFRNLIERRRVIFDILKRRIREEKAESIRNLLQETPYEDKIEERVTELKRQTEKLELEERELRKKDLDATYENSSFKKWKQKAKFYKKILSRESLASIVGAILLLIMGGSLTFAMFMEVETTDIVKSGFWVILGYFFGQATAKKTDE